MEDKLLTYPLRGYSINKEGKHYGFVLLNNLEELCEFITSNFDNKVVTDEMDCLVLDTFGWYLNYLIDIPGLLKEILEVLVPMQTKKGGEI